MGDEAAKFFDRRELAERAAAEAAASPKVRSIHLELAERYAAEAARCRQEARRYTGKPEQQFLLNVAKAFDEVAVERREEVRSGRVV